MRILAINWQDRSHPLAGGAEVHLEEILTRVVAWGHEVTLACSSFKDCRPREVIDGVEICRRGSRQSFNFVAPALVKEIIGERDFDVIVEDVNKIPFYLPLFVRKPHLVVIPHLFGRSIYQEANPVVASYVYLAEKPIPRVYRRSRFLVISDSTRDDLVSRGIQRERIDVAECGVDHQFYSFDQSITKYERPTLIYLGRLKKYKSVHHLIQALPAIKAKIPQVQVLIVGDGDYLEELKRIATRLKLDDCVRFTGFVSAKEKLDYLRRSHISIYPSPKEGWGITNIEANACGTPVVASDVPGLRDSVSAGQSGLLYKYGDLQSMANQIVRMLSDQQLYESLCDGAQEWAQRFTWEDCARKSFACMEETVRMWSENA